MALGAGAQPAEPPATLDAALARIAELEARVAELETRLAAAGVETRRLEVVAGLESKADLAHAADARFTRHHDAAAGRTTVVGPAVPAESNQGLSNARFLVTSAVEFAGATPAGPAAEFSLFIATRGHAHNRLRTLAGAELVVDGEPLAVPLTQYLEEARREAPRGAGRRRRGAVSYDERLRLGLDRAAMTRLAHATRVSVRMDGLVLALTREHLAVFRATLLRGAAGALPRAAAPGLQQLGDHAVGDE